MRLHGGWVNVAYQDGRMMQDPNDIGFEYPVGQDLIDWINISDDFPLDKAHEINNVRWSKEGGRKFEKFSESDLRSIEFFYDNPWQRPQGPLLDVGCAGGHHLKYFAKNGVQPLYGVDIANSYVKKAQEKVPEAIVQQGDFLALPYESNSFNSIVARGVLHLTTTKGLLLVLQELHRILREGGLIYIHRRYKLSLLEQSRAKRMSLFTYLIYHGSLRATKFPMIRNFVPEPQLTSILRSVGFQPLGNPPATISQLVDDRGDIRYNMAYICVKNPPSPD